MYGNCCLDCTDRTLTCHSTCPKYKAYRAEIDKAAKARAIERACSDIEVQRAKRRKKRRKKYERG